MSWAVRSVRLALRVAQPLENMFISIASLFGMCHNFDMCCLAGQLRCPAPGCARHSLAGEKVEIGLSRGKRGSRGKGASNVSLIAIISNGLTL